MMAKSLGARKLSFIKQVTYHSAFICWEVCGSIAGEICKGFSSVIIAVISNELV